MENSKPTNIEFYKALSFLFYAISAADKSIVNKEKLKIIELVNKHWEIKTSDLESKEYIYTILRKLILEQTDADLAYAYFKSFFHLNPDLYPLDLRKKIMDSAYEIASSNAKRNKSEVGVLSRLHQLMFENN